MTQEFACHQNQIRLAETHNLVRLFRRGNHPDRAGGDFRFTRIRAANRTW